MIGEWKHWPRYGVEASYKLGMGWLQPCELVEDWGCGPAYSKRYCSGLYNGIDGTKGFCDKVADLRTYRSIVPGIFMRHVLEHNGDWRLILENALSSFTERMALIFFTSWADKTHVASLVPDSEIPVIRFRKKDILDYISPYLAGEDVIHRKDKPLYDTVFRLEKKKTNGETQRLRNPLPA